MVILAAKLLGDALAGVWADTSIRRLMRTRRRFVLRSDIAPTMSHPPKKSTINNDGMNSAGSWGQPLDLVVGASAGTASVIANVKQAAAIHALAVMTRTVGELVEWPGP